MFDREAILATTDLPALADELLGLHRGSDRSPTWPCPNPDHYQTGRTPPVSIFRTQWGHQQWHCHGCGNGGTAVDLVRQVRDVDARTALQELSQRAGIPELEPGQTPNPRRRPRGVGRHEATPAITLIPRPVPELEHYVAQCADALWQPRGAPIRRWLTDTRALPEDVLRRNRIGADLGPRHQDRPDGVPQVRRAVVLPVLADGQACYAQLRTLGAGPDFPRYLSCRDTLARNPRLGFYHPARSFGWRYEETDLIITEGVIDALSAAAAGYTAAAYLGADLPDRATAVVLARSDRRLIIAFDPDPAGRAAAYRLGQLLRERRRDSATMDLKSGDLNACLVKSVEWPLELAGRIQHAAPRLACPTGGVHMSLA